MELQKVVTFIEGENPAILLDVYSNMLINFNQFFWYHFNKADLAKPQEIQLNYKMSLGNFGEREYVKIVFDNMPIETVQQLAKFLEIGLKYYAKD